MSVEAGLARYVTSLQYDSITEAAKTALSTLWLDHISVALAGHSSPECRRAATALACADESYGCSVIGETLRVSPAGAAFANGVLSHWYDWDDTHDESHVHGGAVIFPALTAAAEHSRLHHRSGEFSSACVAAFDIACRVGGFLKARSHRGWMPTGSAAIGAAAGAARLLGLDEKGVMSAMGIAAANSALSRQALADRVSGKNILAGVAAKNALEAALLAQAGVDGAKSFLTGIYGLQSLQTTSDEDAAVLTRELGMRFSVSEVSIKPYPCCRSTHAALDLAFDLLAERPQQAHQVVGVNLVVPQGVYERCGRPFELGTNPRISAQFSLPFTVALALRHGRVAPADFEPASVRLRAKELANLIENVKVLTEGTSTQSDDVLAPVSADFITQDGMSLQKTATDIKGSPEKPLSPEDATLKLVTASRDYFNDREREELLEATRRLAEYGPGAGLNVISNASVRRERKSLP